ncbi:MAG TPA: hypothetical protein VIQ24_20170 [Pyrinomonadaceae bacterium]
MKIKSENVDEVVRRFVAIEPLEMGDHPPPWSPGQPDAAKLNELIAAAADDLPLAYRPAYVEPLSSAVQHLLRSDDNPANVAFNAETLVGAIYQHDRQSAVRGQLRQFLAVVSNYYRSFLSAAKRHAVHFPMPSDGLPPLAVFQHSGSFGPFTFPDEMVKKLCGAELSVVSLPQRLRAHPVTWLTVAHETAGHDVLHADPDLLPELVGAVRTLFGGGPLTPGKQPEPDQLQALLWSYWIDEVASDVYALLNSGPAFAYNMGMFLEALRTIRPGMGASLIRSSPLIPLGIHPPPVLRLHVAIGVVKNLTSLAPGDRRAHVKNLEVLSKRQVNGTILPVQGRVEVERDRWVDIEKLNIRLDDFTAAARRVGAFIATAPLQAFDGHTIQEIETWDGDDERVTAIIAGKFVKNLGDVQAVKNLGDDAQVLAGATLALLKAPALYDQINSALAGALDESHRRDSIMGYAFTHPMFELEIDPAPPDSQPESDPRAGPQEAGVGAPPLPVPAEPEPPPPQGSPQAK